MLRRVFPLLTALLLVFHLQAQNDVLNTRISLKVRKQSMPEILRLIEQKAGVSLSYNTKIIPGGRYSISVQDEELGVVLLRLLSPHRLSYTLLYGKHIVISRKEKARQRYTVSGYVTDEKTGEKLIGVSVYNRSTLQYVTSNQDGYYSITLPSDSIQLVFSQAAYARKTVRILLSSDIVLDVLLNDDQAYPGYTVTSKPDHHTNYKPDEYHFSDRTLRQLPVLFGESDVMKGLQLLPGVSSGNDGTIGLNIRGGGPDQNLVLLDDVPVYNPSHLYGFFSVFNSDVVKDVKLLKGGLAARYSGRLSSVIDVRTLDGNTKKLRFQASLGLLSSKISIDGPIGKKGKTTFFVSARRSYIDILSPFFSKAFFSEGNSPFRSRYYFYDANAKIKHNFSQKHSLSFSVYTGQDNSYIRNSFSVRDPGKAISEKDRQDVFWGNRIFSLRDHHVLSPRLSAWVNLSYTSYKFGNQSDYEFSEVSDSAQVENAYRHRFVSSIASGIFSYNIEYKPNGFLMLKAGSGMVYHGFGREISTSDNIVQKQIDDKVRNYSSEYNAYLDLAWKPFRGMLLNTGAHAVSYGIQGSAYRYLQPRISANYKPGKSLLLHMAYQSTAQFLHLLTSNTIGMPIDLWLPSTPGIRPETAELLSGGLSIYRKGLALNAEAFHKRMNDVMEYKEQANYIGTDGDWEDKITTGSGRAYGYELLLEKRSGNTKGWISYTHSWNYRTFAGIMQGREFPYKYDRRHNLAVLISHEFSKRTDASLNWVYSSGARFTLPEQVYYVNSGLQAKNVIYLYGDRNNYQFPDYHRLDFSVNFKAFRAHYSRIISLGAYNVYNRLNPFYISPAYNSEGKRVFEAVSLFPILPSIHYKLIF